MSLGETDNGREDPIARVLILYKRGRTELFFSFSYLSFFPCQYNLMHYRLPITYNHHKISLPNYDEHHERRSACLISISKNM